MVNYSEIVNEVDVVRPSEDGQELWIEEKELAVTVSEIMKDTDNSSRVEGKDGADPLEIGDWSQEIIDLGSRFIETAKTIGDQVRNDEVIDPSPVFNDLNGIIKKDLVEKLYEYTMCELEERDMIPRHSVDVTFVSLMIGKGMSYEPKKQLVLGLAAFFANVGMNKIPDNILEKDGKIDKSEKKIIRNYPKDSFEILNRLDKKYKWLSEIALQVYERSDGSGHPNGLKGKEINKLASIIGLVNVYVEMIRDRLYGDNLDQTDAIKYIVDEAKDLFPRKIRKAFLDQVTLFPINSYVILNNQSIGRVLRTNKKWTLRPTIELLYNSQGDKLEKPKKIRLMENPLLYIKCSVNPNDLP
jgi:HD-GYP domain-containing protein (c-di-GMP phosphodiesterase class II)